MSIRLLVVDDHPLIRTAAEGVLTGSGVAEFVDPAASLAEARERLDARSDYALVVLDLNLDDASGMEALCALREAYPDTPVVVLSSENSAETITAAFENNARGYVVKGAPPETLVEAVRTVLGGGTYLPNDSEVRLPAQAERIQLSPRQQDVLRLLLEGLPNKIIANRMGVTENTIKVHMSALYASLNVHTRVQAVLRCRELGLL